MKSLKTISIGAGLLVLFLLFSSVYTVKEGQRALLLQLGKIVTGSRSNTAFIAGPGLHFKWPMIDSVQFFDTRLQTLDILSSRISTAKQKDLIVDYYVKWRITDLPLYFKRTGGDVKQINQLLEQGLNDKLRAQFSQHSINDIVSNDRATLMDAMTTSANTSAQSFGVSVFDVRIKRIELPNELQTATLETMRTELERLAAEYRSSGKAQADSIRANADANTALIEATANLQAAEIRGQGDAIAAKIYADAYSQDPAFYQFLRSMQAYKTIFAEEKNNMLVLRPDSEFFKYFKDANGVSPSKK